MNFQDKNYYKNFIDFLHKIYNSNEYKNEDNEVLIRVIISRAYYTAFLHCRDHLNSKTLNFNLFGGNFLINGKKKSIHDDVVNLIKQTHKREVKLLKRLKNLRLLADYTTNIELLNLSTNQLNLPNSYKINLRLNINDVINDVKHIVSTIPK